MATREVSSDSPLIKHDQPDQPPLRSRLLAALIIGLFVMMAVTYSLVVPPFETPDEVYHYGFVRHLAEGNPLPVQQEGETGPWEQEGSQAPLYYIIAGLLTSPIEQGDFDTWGVRNPRANIGDPLYAGNKNFMLYSSAPRPLQGANLALHIGRWFSTLLGVVTLLGTWWLARLAFTGNPNREALSLAAMALVAAIPQFAFLHGALTNDTLIATVSALTVGWLAALVIRPATTPVRIREWALLGVLLGIAALSKLQGLGLFVLAALAGLVMTQQRRDHWLPLRAFLPVALPAAAIAGWWYLRNIWLYGDWTGLQWLLAINGQRSQSIDLADWWLEFRGLRYSFWGIFGWFNILLPGWVYHLLDAFTLLAGAGAVMALARLLMQSTTSHRQSHPKDDTSTRRVLLLTATWAVLSFALLVYWTITAKGSQGRLLFPALSALAVLAIFGLDFWTRRLPGRVRAVGFGALLVLLLGSSAYALTVSIPNAYRPAPSIAELPPSAQPLDILYRAEEVASTSIELAGIELPSNRIKAHESLPMTLFMRSAQVPQTDLQLFVQLVDEKGNDIANITSHPGWGRRPTTLWNAETLYPDTYALKITTPITNRAPLQARLYVGFIDPATEAEGNLPLPAENRDGLSITPFIAQVTVLPSTPPTIDTLGLLPIQADFGKVIRLTGIGHIPQSSNAGETLTVTILYEAIGTPAADYTAFVHLLDAAGNRIAGFDQPPAGTRFPTAQWRSGDRIASTFHLPLPANLPPGDYSLWTGLYETENVGALLPVTDAGELESGDGRVRIESLPMK